MVNIGHLSQGVHVVNFTSVLVISYTLGGTISPLMGASP